MNVEKISADFQLVGNTIKKFEINNNFIAIPMHLNVEKNLEVSYRIKNIDTIEGEEGFIGIVCLFVNATIQHDNRHMDFELEMDGCFSLSGTNDIENMKEMLSLNGCAALYSIARGYIMSVTSQICLNGTIHLPMINAFILKEE